MLIDYKLGQTSVVLRVSLDDSSSTTGGKLTGLSHTSTGLSISTIADVEATATAYTVAGSNVETIATLGTYAAPTSGKCRFREVDATNHPGLYEIQIANARYAVTNAKSVVITIKGATNLKQCDVLVPLRRVDPYDGSYFGLSHLQSLPSGDEVAVAVWDIATSGLTTTGSAGALLVDIGEASAPTAAAIADAVWDEARSGHTTSGSFGEMMQSKDGDITSATSTTVTLPSPYNTSAYAKRQILVGGQVRVLASLSAGVWTLDEAWSSTPANGTAFYLGFRAGGATAAEVWSHSSRIVTSVTAAVNINLSQTGHVPRNLSGLDDDEFTTGDLLVGAAFGTLVGDRSVPAGTTTLTIKTPGSGTTVAVKTLDSSTTPTAST